MDKIWSIMKALVGMVVEPVKSLPGFAWILVIITAFWTLANGTPERGEFETLIIVGVCWVAYRMGTILDELYDYFYRPERKDPFFWKGEDLQTARDAAAKKLFERSDPPVTDYLSAGTKGYVHPEKSFYSLAASLVKKLDYWEKNAASLNDFSKAARTVFVLSFVSVVLLLFAEVSPETKSWLNPYTERLSVIGTIWFQMILAVVTLVLYVQLRLRHHIELYEYVAKHVIHIPKTDGTSIPHILDEALINRGHEQNANNADIHQKLDG